VRASLVRTGRVFERAARVCKSLAASTLRMRDLRSDTEEKWGRFYALDADIDRGLFPWEEHLIDRFAKAGDRILVVGSGSGRDLIALSAKGYDVCGVDPAAAAVDIARDACSRRGIHATNIHGYYEDVAVPAPFDVIIFSNLCYGCIPETERRIHVLRKAKGELSAGGRVLVSCAGNPQRRRSRLLEVVKLGTRMIGSDWHPEDGDIIEPMPGGTPRFHYEHIFAPGEMEVEAGAAGLRVIYRNASSFDYWLFALTS
jgi:SAM-dependent methyltransferase